MAVIMIKKMAICLIMIGSLVIGGVSAIAADKVVTLRVMTALESLPDEMIVEWNKEHPNIKIVREALNDTKFMADFMAGTPADLMRFDLGADIPYFVKRGLLLDLTDRMRNSKSFKESDYDIGGNHAYKYEGKWYGLPQDYNNVTGITYNKEIFKKAGIAFPSDTKPMTYDEFFALAKRLSSKDGEKVIFGTEMHASWNIFIVDDQAKMIGKRIMNGDVMNEDPEVRALWKRILQLHVEGTSSNLEQPLSGWVGSAFQAGNLAMAQLGYWFGASIALGSEDDGYQKKYGWAPAPVMKEGGKRITSTLGATGIVISSKTKHPDEAYEFFDWFIGGTPGIERAKTGFGIPPLKSLLKLLPKDNEYDRVRLKIALNSVQYMVPPSTSSYIKVLRYVNAWNQTLQALLKGNVDLDGAVDKLYKIVNEEIEMGKEELGE
jgi:multiple sugar transport system substrate-binding protein